MKKEGKSRKSGKFELKKNLENEHPSVYPSYMFVGLVMFVNHKLTTAIPNY